MSNTCKIEEGKAATLFKKFEGRRVSKEEESRR